jgi:hypothetical protein
LLIYIHFVNLPNSNFHLSGFDAQQVLFKSSGIYNWVDENDPNSPYMSNVPAGADYYHENSVTSTGYKKIII